MIEKVRIQKSKDDLWTQGMYVASISLTKGLSVDVRAWTPTVAYKALINALQREHWQDKFDGGTPDHILEHIYAYKPITEEEQMAANMAQKAYIEGLVQRSVGR